MSPKAKPDHESLLTEIRENFDIASDFWRPIYADGDTDMRYVAGDPWEPEERQQREDAHRPCLSLDELGQYYNQLINDVRANPIAVKFSPTGSGANDKGAEFYADKTREIEYRSKAQVAYTTAFQNAVHRSYGYCRVLTKFESDRSFNRELWIEDIPNPSHVLPDPMAMKPDISDQRWCFYFDPYRISEFKREFPRAEVQSFDADTIKLAPSWFKDDTILVAEYWKIRKTRRTLLMVTPEQDLAAMVPGPPVVPPAPVPTYEDELPEGFDRGRLVKQGGAELSREVDVPSVCQYLTNGIEILKTTEWPGKFIPIVSCFGPILYVDQGAGAKRLLMSMTRLARDPYMLYCYYRTCEAELVGMTPKFPYFAYEGQISPTEQTNIAKSLHEPVALIKVKATVEGAPIGTVLPHPQRQPYEPPIQALEIGAEAARRAIQAAMGVSPLPTQAQKHNEKSGVALKQIEETGDRGSYHFKDHYKGMIQQVGVILEDLMDKIHDTARDVGVRKRDNTSDIVRVNDPYAKDASGNPAELSTKGDYLVTVSTGPSEDSAHQEASEAADSILQNPVLMQIAGPQKAPKLVALALKARSSGPMFDQMADIFDPPSDQGQDPKALAGKVAQAGQMIQQLQQALQKAQQIIQTDQVKQQATITKAKIDAANSVYLQKMKDATSISVAQINALTKGVISDSEGRNESIALALQQIQTAHQAEADRAHEALMQGLQHAHESAQADQAHQQALEQGDQGVAGQLAVQAAAPQPETGGAA